MDYIPASYEKRIEVLSESFDTLNLTECACITGILFEYQFTLVGGRWTFQPLQPLESARLVGRIYGHSAETILQTFELEWGKLRSSDGKQKLIDRLHDHELVQSIEQSGYI